jgi:hypothetical protein
MRHNFKGMSAKQLEHYNEVRLCCVECFREKLPYGRWNTADRTSVLFDRSYTPIWILDKLTATRARPGRIGSNTFCPRSSISTIGRVRCTG